MHLMKKLFKVHNKEKFEIHAFSYDMYNEDDTKTDLKKSVDFYHDVRYMSDADVALLAKKQGIDIAVDLKGFTLQSRLEFSHINLLQFKLVILVIQEH